MKTRIESATPTKKSTHGSQMRKWKKDVLNIQQALSLDLLNPKYLRIAKDEGVWEDLRERTSSSHCYVATEAAYQLFGKQAGYVPCHRDNGAGTSHWRLVHRDTGEVLDPTATQPGGRKYPYHEGRRRGFRTPHPSKRAKELIRRVKAAKAWL